LLLLSNSRRRLAAVPSQQVLRRARMAVRRRQANSVRAAASNARSRCDVPAEVCRLFLDKGFNYSCVFFRYPEGDTLEAPQQARLHRTATKLCLQPDVTAVEIGSGLGSFAVHIAKTTGAKVVAINVSPAQIKVSRTLAEREGVASPVEFREMDYRALQGRFDRVISVGMMEHVGIGYFGAHIQKTRELLTDDGFAYVHGSGRMSPPGTTGPFIHKYIFPGAYVPSLSEVRRHRAHGVLGIRCGGATAALLPHAAALAQPLRRPAGRGAGGRTVRLHVGILPVRGRDIPPARIVHGVPDAAVAQAGRRAHRAGLHDGTARRCLTAPPASASQARSRTPKSVYGIARAVAGSDIRSSDIKRLVRRGRWIEG